MVKSLYGMCLIRTGSLTRNKNIQTEEKPGFFPETHTKRQAIQHGCLPNLLGDEDKGSEIVYREEKIFCSIRQLDQPRLNKNFLYRHDKPKNQPKKDPFHLYSLSPHSSQFPKVSRGHPSLVSLVLSAAYIHLQKKRFLNKL
jgi:hypothetical protein